MGCLSGKHPAQEEEGEGEGPQVQEKEDTESIWRNGSPLQTLWSMQGLFGNGGLRKVYELPG